MKYFAYGSNMSSEELRAWCPSAKALGIAKAKGYCLAFTRYSPKWGGGVADIVPASSDQVWGVLYEISDSEIPRLDAKEGVAGGAYKRERIKVATADGTELDVLTYSVVDKDRFQRPTAKYLQTMLKEAAETGLPKQYVRRMREIPTQ